VATRNAGRLSYCLKHQNVVTDVRCAACLKPICPECTLNTEKGTFCGSECYDKRVASDERVEALRLQDEADRGPRLMRTLIRWTVVILVLIGAYMLYPRLPKAVRAPITRFVHHIQYPDKK
jgi:hypothetical protein